MQFLKTSIILPILVICCLLVRQGSIQAQPSGGPYGPVPQRYKLPATDGTIYFVAPDGKDDNSGSSVNDPTTIEKAFSMVVTGDAIILRGGTYRTGNLILNQGITLQAYEDELPVLKGSYVAESWRDLRNGLWISKWEYLFPMKPQGWWRRERSGKSTPLHRFNNDMVFVDGRFLQSAAYEGEVDENTFYIDYEAGLVYIGTDPKDHQVEITAFDVSIHRTTGEAHGKESDGIGPVIRGITFTQYAYRALEFDGKNPEGISDEANHGKDVTGTVIEHCTISFCSRVAAYLRGDKLVLRHCRISDTSTEGIFLLSSSDVLMERNIFARNNIEHIQGYYPAAVKIFNQCCRVTCNDNLVIDQPWSNGIWYDVGNVDGIFTNNWIEGVGHNDFGALNNRLWFGENGFFFEISKGAIVAGNVFVNCDNGIKVLNSSNVKIWNNTFINSMIAIRRDSRSAAGDLFDWHPATGPDVDKRYGHVFKNNLLTGDENFSSPMLLVSQSPDVCEQLQDPQLDEMDNNVFVRSIQYMDKDLIFFGPAGMDPCYLTYESPQELHRDHKSFSGKSKAYMSEQTPLFKGSQLGYYELVKEFPAHQIASPLPENIRGLLQRPKNDKYIGAYPMYKPGE